MHDSTLVGVSNKKGRLTPTTILLVLGRGLASLCEVVVLRKKNEGEGRKLLTKGEQAGKPGESKSKLPS